MMEKMILVEIPAKKTGRPTKRPDAQTLNELYSKYTAREIGEMYGVPMKTVEYWIYTFRREYEKAIAKKS